MLFIRCANKSYTFNPDHVQLVPDVTKIPKLLPYEKTTIIKKWNSKWTQIAPQLPVQRPTLGRSSNTALMMTGTAVNTTPTDCTASTVGVGAGVGIEAVIEAPSAEVPTT